MRPGRRRRLALALAALSIASCPLFARSPSVSTGFSTPSESYDIPPVIAHMAKGTDAPPNTIAAVRNHLSRDIGALELDVQLSADGVPMVFHDYELDAATNGSGTFASHTASELAELRLVVDGRVTEHAIPTLDDVLALVGSRKFLFLDAKEPGVGGSELPEALARAIERHDLHRTVIVESFNPLFLRRTRQIDPRVRLMFDFADDAQATDEESPDQLASIPWLLRQEWFRRAVRGWTAPDLLGPRFSVSRKRLQSLAALGYPLVAWTVDDPDLAAALFASGVIAIQSNEPFRIAAALEGRVPRFLDDASRSNRTAVSALIRVQDEGDILAGLARARETGARVPIAGRRHSMGGHTFAPGSVVLDMTSLRSMSLDPVTGTLSVQSGATWADVQRYLDARGRAVEVMQSDTIFTVGGTLSVNAHGWQPNSGPVSSTVESVRVALASGEIVRCSRTERADLFSAVLGGYGLLGVIVDARLRTVPNEVYEKRSWFFPTHEFPRRFREHVAGNARAGLAYGRLSVHEPGFLSEAGLHVYERVDPQPEVLPAMEEEGFVSLKREIFRSSERGNAAKLRRWWLEKRGGPWLELGPVTRNTAMHPDVHLLWPEDPDRRDILHEYFVPHDAFGRFVEGLGEAVKRLEQNLLNVTVRDVRRDQDTLLAYAGSDSFALVLLFSQETTNEAEEAMRGMTRELIDLATRLGGSFYLPYRLHYSREQFHAAYPGAREFLATKARYDPEGLFSSWFYRHIEGDGTAGLPAPDPVLGLSDPSRSLIRPRRAGRASRYE